MEKNEKIYLHIDVDAEEKNTEHSKVTISQSEDIGELIYTMEKIMVKDTNFASLIFTITSFYLSENPGKIKILLEMIKKQQNNEQIN